MCELRSLVNSRLLGELIKFFWLLALPLWQLAKLQEYTATPLSRISCAYDDSQASPKLSLIWGSWGRWKLLRGSTKWQARPGAGWILTVFELLKFIGKVYTAIIANARTVTLMLIIEQRVELDSIVYSDMFWVYNAMDVSDFNHHRIDYSKFFAKHGNHINEIENFLSQAKRQLHKFNGITPEHFYLFQKECECGSMAVIIMSF